MTRLYLFHLGMYPPKADWAVSSAGAERVPYKHEVRGSNPLPPTHRFRASRFAKREGQRFESSTAHAMYFVYILESLSSGRYYVGSTRDIWRRLGQHNSGKTTSTRNDRPWKLVYFEQFQSMSDAIKRERQIKSRKSRIYIENLIHESAR